MLKETIVSELESVRSEIEQDSEQERATLEGWEKALIWVLKEIEREGK